MATKKAKATTVQDANAAFVASLKSETAPLRVMRERFGLRRSLSPAQREIAAGTFHAEGGSVSASKKLLDSKHPAVRDVNRVMGEALDYWRFITVPYPEPGVRLIRRSQIGVFESQMNHYVSELADAVAALNNTLDDLKADAKKRLGSLYNPSDYPETLTYHLYWDYPTIAVPEYLKQLNPLLYEREKERLEARFEEAVALHEELLVTELNSLVVGLVDKLTATGDDGRAKAIRQATLDNFDSFFERVDKLGVGNDELAGLVAKAKDAIHGKSIEDIRTNDGVRSAIAASLGVVADALETQIVARNRLISFEDEQSEETEETAVADAAAVG